MSDEDVIREALRLYGRYAEEFVEALHLCPWAASARRSGAADVRVLLEERPGSATDAVLADAAPALDVLILVYPRARAERRPWEREVAAVRERLGKTPAFALAAFHPDARPDPSTPARLVPFVRKSPDPTIQAIRFRALDAVRKRDDAGSRFVDPATVDLGTLLSGPPPAPPLHERVAAKNLAILRELGLGEAERILAAIHADRSRSYP
ncbi:MAG: hypothetical protein AAGH15_21800 [Myxococcota bacterium]